MKKKMFLAFMAFAALGVVAGYFKEIVAFR